MTGVKAWTAHAARLDPTPSRLTSAMKKSGPVGVVQLGDQALAQTIRAVALQIVVEVAKRWHERQQVDPCCLCPISEHVPSSIPGRIAIARDIEAAEVRRKQDSSQMR